MPNGLMISSCASAAGLGLVVVPSARPLARSTPPAGRSGDGLVEAPQRVDVDEHDASHRVQHAHDLRSDTDWREAACVE